MNGIHQEIAAHTERGKVAGPHPCNWPPSIPQHFGIAITTVDGQEFVGRRGRHRLLHPERVQGVHADAGAGHGGRPALEQGRPRAIGHCRSTRSSSWSASRASRAIPSSMPAPSPWPTCCWPGTEPKEIERRDRAGRPLLAPVTSRIVIDEARRPLGNRDRLPQLCAGPVHADLRQARPSGRARAGRLFPPLRARHDLPAALARRPVPGRRRTQLRRRDARWFRAARRGASTR